MVGSEASEGSASASVGRRAAGACYAVPMSAAPGPDFERVLSFWIGDPEEDVRAPGTRVRRWFQGGDAVDRDVRTRFGDLVVAAQRGDLDGWATSARPRLALVILLDQLSRNMFRGDPRAHAGDDKALALAVEAYERRWDDDLTLEERRWLVMPLLHAEDVPTLERAKAVFLGLAADAPAAQKGGFEAGASRAEKYRAVVARFGRFPHRNTLLGRVSTPEEEAFLETWDGPGGKRPPGAVRP